MKGAIAGLAVSLTAGLAAVGMSSSASATTGHAKSPATSGVATVRTAGGGIRTIPLKSSGTPNTATGLASGPSFHGCPYGAVCVYPANTGWNGDHPKYAFFSYAGHNIFNEFGTHRIADNQYGAHAAGLCAGSNGTGGFANVEGLVGEGNPTYSPFFWDQNLTPVNSLDLRPLDQYGSLCLR